MINNTKWVVALFALLTFKSQAACVLADTTLPELCQYDESETKKCQEKDLRLSGYLCHSFKSPCKRYADIPEFSFAPFDVTPAVIDNISLPRKDFILYRGTDPRSGQFTLTKFIRGVFGDPTPTIGTKIFSAMSSSFSGPQFDPNLFNFNAEKNINEVRKCQSVFKPDEALYLAKEAFNKNITAASEKMSFKNKYMNYFSSNYDAYGNWGDMVLYSALYPRSANQYGKMVLSFTDKAHRGFDANYWNYVHKKKWYRYEVDVGEYLLPGYVNPQEYLGLWYNDGSGYHLDFSPRHITMGYMAMTSSKGEKYILVYKGDGTSQCALPGNDGNVYPCQDEMSWYTKALFPAPIIRQDLPPFPVIAVIVACPLDKKCSLPEEVVSRKYETAQMYIEEKVIQEVNNLIFTNSNLAFKTRWIDL